ncbi:hypothetical protein N0V87_003554 [Didymella glomerata]|uniref:Uncharacterized protein n=1 Tax=Didymella glomerata TaxID=749621 RepID=A0A9W8X1R5_9PLEO|nr:hypothetical protein N0V87_003554 [Didymella glomerata]
MTSCSLVAPGLVSEVSGAMPTFSYRRTAHAGDYFGVQMTYLNGRSTCYQTGALPGFTPVIKNQAAGYTVNCQFITQGTTYTGIYCPPASVTSIPDGMLTVSYINSRAGQPTPIPFLATFVVFELHGCCPELCFPIVKLNAEPIPKLVEEFFVVESCCVKVCCVSLEQCCSRLFVSSSGFSLVDCYFELVKPSSLSFIKQARYNLEPGYIFDSCSLLSTISGPLIKCASSIEPCSDLKRRRRLV